MCRQPIEQPPTGRRRRWCSNACRQRGYHQRARRAEKKSRWDWWTPRPLAAELVAAHAITLDAAAHAQNAIVADYLGPDHPDPARRDALAFNSWAPLVDRGTIWVNPPYPPTQLRAFLTRAATTAADGIPVLTLIPFRPDTRWWHDTVEATDAHVTLTGRLRFGGPYSSGQRAPFTTALVHYLPRARTRRGWPLRWL